MIELHRLWHDHYTPGSLKAMRGCQTHLFLIEEICLVNIDVSWLISSLRRDSGNTSRKFYEI